MFKDGDLVVHENFHAQIVGVKREGYDIVRHTDHKVIRDVNHTELAAVG